MKKKNYHLFESEKIKNDRHIRQVLITNGKYFYQLLMAKKDWVSKRMKKKQLYPRSIWFFFRNSIGFFALFFFLMIINDYDGDVVWSVDYVVSIMIIIIIIDKQTRLKQKYHNHHHHSHDDDGDHHHQHYTIVVVVVNPMLSLLFWGKSNDKK